MCAALCSIYGGFVMGNNANPEYNKKKISRDNRPEFPKRAVITGGMPYGNKQLHFGHVGGVFVFADVYARFLRDRIGKDNVIFVSGTDCYGSPIAESYPRSLRNKHKPFRRIRSWQNSRDTQYGFR